MNRFFRIALSEEGRVEETTKHILLFGLPGTAKTFTIERNIVEDDKVNLLVIDLAGELSYTTARLKEAQGYEVLTLNAAESVDPYLIDKLMETQKVAVYIESFLPEANEKAVIAQHVEVVLSALSRNQDHSLRLIIDHASSLFYVPTLPHFLTVARSLNTQVVISLQSMDDLKAYDDNEKRMMLSNSYLGHFVNPFDKQISGVDVVVESPCDRVVRTN